jgi:hypothetical protein
MKKRLVASLIGFSVGGVVVAAAALVLLKPRPATLSVTARPGDDTVVINTMHATRLGSSVLDQYGRRLPSDSLVRYQWLGGDSISVGATGDLRCNDRRDAIVRAVLGKLIKEFVLHCRPVASVEAASWLDLMVGDSSRDLSFVAHGPDGRAVTELRGAISVGNGSIVHAEGTTIRPKRAGQTFAAVEVGDIRTIIPIVVYQPVTSFVAGDPKRGAMMAMRVSLARGDTLEMPLPKAAFWVTYYSKDRSGIPPTIELRGDGSCTTGNGLSKRRIEEGQYAKYCLTRDGASMMIAHGASGAATVTGVVALRLDW